MRDPQQLVIVFAACAALTSVVSAAPPAMHTVVIKGLKYTPEQLTVKVGDTVIWKNEDIVPHTVFGTRKLESKNLAKGQSWSFVARRAGRFPYICSYHPTMRGTLIVK